MKLRQYIVYLFLTLSVPLVGQLSKEDKAKKEFDNYEFIDAIESHEKLVEKGMYNADILKRLGDANYVTGNYKKAAEWYSNLMSLDSLAIDAGYLYRYAQSMKSLGQYETSDFLMKRFAEVSTEDQRALEFAKNQEYLNEISEKSGRFELIKVNFNSKLSDFAPSFYQDTLVFTSARDTGLVIKKNHAWTKQPFLNLYKVDENESGDGVVMEFSAEVNSFAHESSTVFTKSGNTVYFTRNNAEKNQFKRDKKGVSRLKLMRADYIDGVWQNEFVLPFNEDGFSTANPALSPDEKTLYFVSDMPGTIGQSDIFKVAINSDGSFGDPENLGPKVNTEGRETFPFIDANGLLYFSSDGRPGLGGLDVFVANIKGANAEVQNLGKPVNSPSDDFSFIINPKTNSGYFASNRSGGKGDDDIYAFVATVPITFGCTATASGFVINEVDGSLVAKANIEVINRQGQVVGSTITNNTGEFSISLDCAETQDFLIIGKKEGFGEGNVEISFIGSFDVNEIEIGLKPDEKPAEVGTDLAEVLELQPIYFDKNKSDIRPEAEIELDKVIEYMSKFPEVKVSIRAHTDSQGRDSYNLSLSDRRAKSSMDYLVANGIAEERLTAEGFGETQLVNECANGVECSKEKHEENRRSEFIIVQ
ncbi:OmpA family protein [Croceivirga thetidis]|uniref:OmpA family protein n=1 Tax=Croceivirga thetidis TaxID=2721623 RepID=A0ABX1GLF2_9FLAO|nr:OmpA family protein [Croceivirga thetidis]NKI30703.1 OmpA family protein [Croceivirga thetidis]